MDIPDTSTILSALLAYNVTKYFWVAATAAMMYEYLLTIEHEARVWQRQWSLGKVLYLLIRYWGTISVIIDITGSVQCAPRQIYVVYGGKKMIAVILGFILAIGVAATIMIYNYSNVTGQAVDVGLSGCKSSTLTPLFGYLMLPTLMNETILCLLMLFKAWKAHKTGSKSPLLGVVIRDKYGYHNHIAG
ncbi:hypothetical protein BU17DRAFT_63681 [Hysterangium stoloniferum]|nr:hypothetical protein BU17DRAFT_63681 [Hysterangium stoloniferum]